MGKGKEISMEIRKLIIKLYLEKKSLREIGRIVGKTHSSVQNIINFHNSNGNVQKKPRSGRPKKISEREERYILNAIKADPKKSAPKIRDELLQGTATSVNPQTIRNVLHKAGYNGRVPRRKPLISPVNKKTFGFCKGALRKARFLLG